MVSMEPRQPVGRTVRSLMPLSPAALWTTCLLVAAAGIVSQFFYMPHHDMAWLLYAAERVMAGDTLYQSLIEVNPPLIVHLSAIGVVIASALDISRTHGWVIFVALQALASLWLMNTLLRRALAYEAPDLAPPLIALVAWTFTCLPGREFGQREHLMVLWITPYLVAAATGASATAPSWLRASIGLLVGLTVCLKPYYAIPIALVEVFLVAWSARSVRPWFRLEMIVAAVIGAAYFAFVRIRYPLFFSTVLPMALQYYVAYGTTWIGLFKPVHVVYVIGTAIALTLGRRAPPVAARIAAAFVLAAVGSYLTLLLQAKGWSYHFLPTKAYLTLASAVGLLAFARSAFAARGLIAWRRSALVSAAAALLALGAATTWSLYQVYKHRTGREYQMVQTFERFFEGRRQPPETLVMLSPSMFPGFPLVELLHVTWGIRFDNLWVLPGLLDEEARSPDAPDRLLTVGRLAGMLAEDIDASKPEYVIVERRAKVANGSVDVLGLLLPHARFRRAWDGYVLVQNVDGFEVYGRGTP
jgi:hypothetical protein